ncbi:hypothetical protein [Streptomyces sp. NPDC046985]|uniref:hypothetical protein n=1 Tax=Streptomyces sp. NPDC046985 TaxID=3155377 RepID=UPI00340F3E76
MITNIALTRLKSVADCEFTPGTLTVLTGYSGAGKTSILDALSLVSRTLSDGFDAATASGRRLAPGTLLFQSEHAGKHRTAPTMRITVEAVINGPVGSLPVAVDLAAVRSADGRTALFDASASGVRTFDPTGARQLHPLDGSGALLEALRTETRGWSAICGDPHTTAEALR